MTVFSPSRCISFAGKRVAAYLAGIMAIMRIEKFWRNYLFPAILIPLACRRPVRSERHAKQRPQFVVFGRLRMGVDTVMQARRILHKIVGPEKTIPAGE